MKTVLAVLLAFAGSTSIAAAQEHRELGPHVHGTSSINIAIEGDTVSIDLDAPGMDIVGFEHDPSTPEQQAAIDAAIKMLNDPMALFGIPAAADCKISSAQAGPEEHEHEEEEQAAAPIAGAAAPAGEEAHHSDFAGTYTLSCGNPAEMKTLDFGPYFAGFAGAQLVNVQLISDTTQISAHLDRGNAKLNISGQP